MTGRRRSVENAYQKKYDANHVRLVYPMTEKLTPEEPISYKALDGAQVHVEFVDLYDINNSIDGLVKRMISLSHDKEGELKKWII